MERKADIKILNVFIVAVILFFSIMMIGAEQEQEAIRYNSTYHKYGYYSQQKIMVSSTGLQYNPRENGGMDVLNQAGIKVTSYGTCLSGNVQGEPITACEPDYEWTWKHTTEDVYFSRLEVNSTDDVNNITYVMQKEIFTGNNNNPNLNWTKEYTFTPLGEDKMKDTITNNFADVTNVKFWYVMKKPGTIRFNGQEHNTDNVEFNQQGNFNNFIPRIDFGAGTFLYQDMLNDNFDLVHIYMGNGTPIGYDNKKILALGFTKGSGNFNLGQTFVLDPVSTGSKFPTTTGDPYTNWTNSDNIFLNDGAYATSTTVNDTLWTGGYTFDIPDNAFNITGFQILLDGITKELFCGIKQNSQMKTRVSLDNGTTLSDESIFYKFPCTTGTTDTTITKGSSTDTFGLGAMNASNITSDIRFAINFFSQTAPGIDPNPGQDLITVTIFYDVPPPELGAGEGQMVTSGVINATFLHNITSITTPLTVAWFETNYTLGILTNYSLTNEGGGSLYFSRRFEGIDFSDDSTTGDGDWGAINGTVLSGTIWGCAGTLCDSITLGQVNVSSIPPNVSVNSPLDGSNQWGNLPIVFNITNNDIDEDVIDVIVVRDFGDGFFEQNYIHIEHDLEFGESTIHNQTVGILDSQDPDLKIWWRLDNKGFFGEKIVAGNVTFRNFANDSDTVSATNSQLPTETCLEAGFTDIPSDDCVAFDGGQHIIIDDIGLNVGQVLVDNNFTISGYAKSGPSTIGRMLNKDDFFSFGPGIFRLNNNSESGLQCNAFTSLGLDTEPHMWTFVGGGDVDNPTVKIYRDGVFDDEEICTSWFLNLTAWEESSDTLCMGGLGGTCTTAEIDGWIDEVLLYNKTLSPREVRNLYSMTNITVDWTARLWEANDTFMDIDSTFLNFRTLINVTEEVTLEELFTNLSRELPDDVSLLNLSDGTTPCRYVARNIINVDITGELIMESCTLEMNSTSGHGQYKLIVNGNLTANYSNFTRTENKNYDFYTGENAYFTMLNSYIFFAGSEGADNFRSLTLNTPNVIFRNNTLSHGFLTNLQLNTDNLTIEDSTFLGPPGLTTSNVYSSSNGGIIINSNITDALFDDVFVRTNNDLTLLNTTHDTHNVPDNGLLTVQWYVNGLVQNSSGPINNSEVVFYNITGDITHNITTNESGNIPQQNVTEYTVNETSLKTYQTNYTINASAAGHDDGTLEFNFTTSDSFVMNLIVTGVDSCTYTSGNWLIDFADNCIISSNVIGDALADILVTGIGSLTVNNGVRISGFDFLFTRDTGILNQIGSGGFDL